MAGLFGMLLTSTRFVGIAILPALLYEFYIQEKLGLYLEKFDKQKLLSLIYKLSPILITPLGLFGYMFFNYVKWGNPLFFIEVQGQFQNNRTVSFLVFVPQTIYRYIKMLVTVSPSHFEWWMALLEISVFIFISALFYIAIKKKVHFSYMIFAFLCFLIPISTGTFTGLPRYSLVLFPVFITMALIKNKTLKVAYVIISTILLFILLMLFSRGYYIG